MAEIKIEDLYSKGGVPLQNQVQRNTTDIASLKLDIRNTAGTPVLSTAWVQLRTSMWSGYVAADGQLLKRADYPDAWEAIEAGKVPVVSDVDWLADPANRGCFTAGDGSTTFRVPDYNGMQPGSYGPVYLGGGSAASGAILRDRIQEFEINTAFSHTLNNTGGDINKIGSFTRREGNSSGDVGRVNSSGARYSVLASELARAGDTTRPITAEGCLAIKLFGAVQNAGSIDAMGLATQVAEAQSKIAELESWPQSGSNSNGSWIKHRDGTLVCTGTRSLSTLKLNNPLLINYPVAFIATPIITYSIMSYAGNYYTAPIYAFNTDLNANTSFSMYSQAASAPPEAVSLSYHVVGRWK